MIILTEYLIAILHVFFIKVMTLKAIDSNGIRKSFFSENMHADCRPCTVLYSDSSVHFKPQLCSILSMAYTGAMQIPGD